MSASRASNDFLLPTMITFLNDRGWQLRAAFFQHIPCMGACAGFAGLEAFLLPCLEQVPPPPPLSPLLSPRGLLNCTCSVHALQ